MYLSYIISKIVDSYIVYKKKINDALGNLHAVAYRVAVLHINL